MQIHHSSHPSDHLFGYALSIPVIAECSEANNGVLWARQSQLAFIYKYINIHKVSVSPIPRASGGKARVQNGVSGCCSGAVFEVIADEESEVWINLSCSFIKGGLVQLPGCVAVL